MAEPMLKAVCAASILTLAACAPSVSGYSGDGVTVRKSVFNSEAAAAAEASRVCAMKGERAQYLGSAGYWGGWFGADSDVTYACVKG